MATYVYDDFRVTFTPRAEGDFTVRAVEGTGTSTTGVFTLPLSGDDLERAVLEVAHARAARRTRRAEPAPLVVVPAPPVLVPAAPTSDGPTTRDVGGDGPPAAAIDAEQLGGALADALLLGPLGEAYGEAATRAAANRRGLRLTLSLAEAPALLSVPWEFLYRRPRFLASQRHSPVVRLLDTGSKVPPPTIDTKVRMLAVVASPKDLPALDVDGERRRIEQVVAGMAAADRIELDWLDPATPRALRHALRDGNYHVLHYVGHSAFTALGEGMLYLEQEPDGTSIPVDSTLFANLLADQDRLRLVVLNSCEGARTTLSDPYAGVATTLIQLGVPAVVAMQFEISDDAALVFAEELYTNLIGRQDPIDAAVAEARKAVYTEVDPLEWATPVLFVRDPDVELFRFEVPAAPLPAPPPPGQDAEPKDPRWVRPVTKFASWTQRWPRALRWVASVLAVVALAAAGYGIYRVIADDGEPPPPRPVQFPTVDAGSIGAEVTAAQYLLREHDSTSDHVTGVFDEETKEAIRRFEATLPAVPDDGILGPLTWSELVVPIQQGMEGDAVRAIQTLLNNEGAELVIDGRFGPRTHAAVVAFERDNGFHVDGIVDDDVWKLLVARAAAPAAAD
jgi:peptidoglycan hydrolase-like protein with peptidoglycan-binding domain